MSGPVADEPQLRWFIVKVLLSKVEGYIPDCKDVVEEAAKIEHYLLHGKPLPDLEEIDRNSRAYGWEVGVLGLDQSDVPFPETFQVSEGNPFVRDDYKEDEQ